MEIMQIGDSGPATPVEVSQSAAELLEQGAACNVLFIGSADTESLTGPEVGFWVVVAARLSLFRLWRTRKSFDFNKLQKKCSSKL